MFALVLTLLGHDMGRCETREERRTYHRTTPRIFLASPNSFRPDQSLTYCRETQSSNMRGGWKTYQTIGFENHPFLGGVPFMRVSSLFFYPMVCSDTCFCSFGHAFVAFVAASFRLTRNILMPTIPHNPPSERPKPEEIVSRGGRPKIICCTPPQEGTEICTLSVVIFFSLTEPPLPGTTPTPPNTTRLARSRPKLTESDRNGTPCIELDILQAFRGGGQGGCGVCRDGGGVVREKNHYLSGTKTLRFTKR